MSFIKNCFMLFLFATIGTTTTINIMTFNIRRDGREQSNERKWNERKNHVFNFLDAHDLDIFGLQEATINQINDVACHSNHYSWTGKGRGKAWFGLALNEYNPIFYNQQKFNLLKSETFFINKKSLWFLQINKTGFIPRICTWALFEDVDTKKQLLIFNTHLDHQYNKAKLSGLKKILNKITKISQYYPDATILLTGDFNHDVQGKIAKQLQSNGFLNTRDVAQNIQGPYETINHWGEKKPDCIDHILIGQSQNNNPLITLHKTVQEEPPLYLSDHRPVIATIKV